MLTGLSVCLSKKKSSKKMRKAFRKQTTIWGFVCCYVGLNISIESEKEKEEKNIYFWLWLVEADAPIAFQYYRKKKLFCHQKKMNIIKIWWAPSHRASHFFFVWLFLRCKMLLKCECIKNKQIHLIFFQYWRQLLICQWLYYEERPRISHKYK